MLLRLRQLLLLLCCWEAHQRRECFLYIPQPLRRRRRRPCSSAAASTIAGGRGAGGGGGVQQEAALGCGCCAKTHLRPGSVSQLHELCMQHLGTVNRVPLHMTQLGGNAALWPQQRSLAVVAPTTTCSTRTAAALPLGRLRGGKMSNALPPPLPLPTCTSSMSRKHVMLYQQPQLLFQSHVALCAETLLCCCPPLLPALAASISSLHPAVQPPDCPQSSLNLPG